MSDSDSVPVRSCIGCRQRRPQPELVRITRSSDGSVVVDGASSGRGAWLCRTPDGDPVAVLSCLESALSRRAFARAWRCDLGAHDQAAIRSRIVGRVAHDDIPGAH